MLQPRQLQQRTSQPATSSEDGLDPNIPASGLLGSGSGLGEIVLGSTQWCARYSQRRPGLDPVMCQELLHVSDGDQNGVLNFIGTQYGTQVGIGVLGRPSLGLKPWQGMLSIMSEQTAT